MKNEKLVIGLSVTLSAILVSLLIVVACVIKFRGQDTIKGQKNIEVTIVYADETSKEFDINTDAEFLADALFEEGIVTETEYKTGFYTEIDGVKADYNVDQSWWCVTKDGEMTSVGMNEVAISDGDKYEITYTIS